MHQFKVDNFLPVSKEVAWRFFSSPQNLREITPPELDFRIISKLHEEEIYEGMIINYMVKPLLGINVHWQTEISKVQNQKYFIDKQLIGPYKYWEHTHTFIEKDNGVLMTDVVNYELPFGFLGKMTEALIVRRKIKTIFSYRQKILEKLFN